MPERLLQFIWAEQLLTTTHHSSTTHERVDILHQGVLNTLSGPDFERAKVLINNTMHYGAIEIHVNEKSWYEHKHHKDKVYNTVILHVVYQCSKQAIRQDGTAIPTICIAPAIKKSSVFKYDALVFSSSKLLCSAFTDKMTDLRFVQLYSRMLAERMEQRFIWIQKLHKELKYSWVELIYVLILRSIGSPHNQEAFISLGKSVPYKILTQLSNFHQVSALLIGQCGLISLKNKAMLKEYRYLKSKYQLQPIPFPVKNNSVRPQNSPLNRIIQLAEFITADTGQLNKLMQINTVDGIRQCIPTSYGEHFFTTVMINAIIPFKYFEAVFTGDDMARELAIKMLHDLPSEKNKVIRLFNNHQIVSRNAAESQGLLHLYKTYCTFRRCLDCSFGKQLIKEYA